MGIWTSRYIPWTRNWNWKSNHKSYTIPRRSYVLSRSIQRVQCTQWILLNVFVDGCCGRIGLGRKRTYDSQHEASILSYVDGTLQASFFVSCSCSHRFESDQTRHVA